MVGEERAVWRKSQKYLSGPMNLLLNTKLHVHKVKVHEARQTILRAPAGLRGTLIGDSKEVTL